MSKPTTSAEQHRRDQAEIAELRAALGEALQGWLVHCSPADAWEHSRVRIREMRERFGLEVEGG